MAEAMVMDAVIEDRVRQLFQSSDQESKGFLVKRDMQRMRSELSLTPEQLEMVFDTLDTAKSGYLTLQQFLDGFGNFLCHRSVAPAGRRLHTDVVTEASSSFETCDDQFAQLVDQLGETRLLDDTEAVRRLCDGVVRHGDTQMQFDLEAVLRQLLEDLRRQQVEIVKLEATIKRRDEAHTKQVSKLFDEMESHLKEEKERVVIKVDQRLRQVRRQLETEVVQKREELKEVTSQKHRLAFKLQLMKSSEANMRRNYAKLVEEKLDLSTRCDRQTREIKLLKRRLCETQLGGQQKHVASGFRLAQRIIIEEQGLLQQLKQLKTIAQTLEESNKREVEVKQLT